MESLKRNIISNLSFILNFSTIYIYYNGRCRFYCKIRSLNSLIYYLKPGLSRDGVTMMLVLVAALLARTESFVMPRIIHNISCDFYDERNCTDVNNCESTVEHCEEDSQKPSLCYVVGSVDNVTG